MIYFSFALTLVRARGVNRLISVILAEGIRKGWRRDRTSLDCLGAFLQAFTALAWA